MSINSISFIFFFAVVFAVYYLPIYKSTSRYQNIVLFVASYAFYAFSDWRMLVLLLCSTIAFYYIGIWMKQAIDKERWRSVSALTTTGVVLGVGILLYFKYLNFFAESIADTLSQIGIHASWSSLNIILPVGVSFFTFKLISYILEVNKESIEPTKDFVKFGTYIAFFPTIMAGPIDRPNIFMPQLGGARNFNYPLAVDGCRQILWGMFMKMCIADNIATVTDTAWNNLELYSGFPLILVMLLYPIQLYADFAGYSDMAIGVSKLLGFRVARNFNHPFMARNIAEFWRRWHISLTTWVTDYVYTPLSYSFRNWGKNGVITAVIINLVVIGLWHGASWNYAIFGLYHGFLFVPLILKGTYANKEELKDNKYGFPYVKDLIMILFTYLLVAIGAVFFRAENIGQISTFYTSLFYSSELLPFNNNWVNFTIVMFVPILIICEWYKRGQEHPLLFQKMNTFKRWCVYWLLTILIYVFQGSSQEFIYFQF